MYAKHTCTPSVDAVREKLGDACHLKENVEPFGNIGTCSISVVQTFSDYICMCNQLQNIATYCRALLVYKINYTTTIEINRSILIERFYIRCCCSYLWYTCTMIICSVYYDKISYAILAIIIMFSIFSVLFSVSPNPNHNQ